MNTAREENSGVLASIASVLIILLCAGFCVVAAWPSSSFSQLVNQVSPFAQMTAFARIIAAVAGFLAALTVGRILFRKKYRHYRLSLFAGIVCLGASIILVVNPAIPWWDRGPISSAATAGEVVTVVSFNTQNTLTKIDIDQLVTRFDPDVIVLPETSNRVVRTVTPGDYSLTPYLPLPDGLTSTCHGQVAPTAVLAHNRLGRIRQVSAPPTSFGTVALISQHPKLRVVGVHAAPPLPSLIPQWRADLNRLATLDQPAIPTVLAGDFNATLRHGFLANRIHLADAAEACGLADQGTWPASLPASIATPIDHIFVSRSIEITSCQILNLGSSDHHALIATLIIP